MFRTEYEDRASYLPMARVKPTQADCSSTCPRRMCCSTVAHASDTDFWPSTLWRRIPILEASDSLPEHAVQPHTARAVLGTSRTESGPFRAGRRASKVDKAESQTCLLSETLYALARSLQIVRLVCICQASLPCDNIIMLDSVVAFFRKQDLFRQRTYGREFPARCRPLQRATLHPCTGAY
jgi:hypothetical protein